MCVFVPIWMFEGRDVAECACVQSNVKSSEMYVVTLHDLQGATNDFVYMDDKE